MDADRLADAVAKHPRGVRNANPCNLKAGQGYLGESGKDAQGFARFTSPCLGIRAGAVDLLTKYRRGLVTVRSIISVYAPPSENDTEAYIRAVCDALGVTDYAWLHLLDGDVLARMVAAIIKQECGPGWYPDDEIARCVGQAL